jgi:glycosyltransferase involved in cell wall biosynthesis
MGTVALALCAYQRELAFDARIWCADPPSAAGAADLTPVVRLPSLGPSSFAYSPGGQRRARVERADVVHQHGLWTAQSWITREFRRRSIPTVVAPHGSLEPVALRRRAWKKRLALAGYEARNLREASCLQATSEQELQTIRVFGLTAPVAIVPNGIDPGWLASTGDGGRFRQSHGIGTDARVMLFLSRIHPIKGLALLIQAVAEQPRELQGWRVVVAGEGDSGHRREMTALAERLGVRPLVHFVGALFAQDKRDAYAAADLFVLPTRSENFGLVVAEALACGVPAITTRAAPWSELHSHDCGWWVEVGAGPIGAAIADAARRPQSELKDMGARGRALVASRYLWPRVAARTADLYRWMRGDSERPPFVFGV